MAQDKERDFGWLVIVALIAVAMSVAILIAAAMEMHDRKKAQAEITTPTVSVPAVTPAVVESASEDQQLDMLLFSYVIDKACHDKKNNIWFLHVPIHKPNKHRMDGGWYETDGFEYKILENNTLFITSEKEWNRQNVNITGLSCKEQKVDMSFFK